MKNLSSIVTRILIFCLFIFLIILTYYQFHKGVSLVQLWRVKISEFVWNQGWIKTSEAKQHDKFQNTDKTSTIPEASNWNPRTFDHRNVNERRKKQGKVYSWEDNQGKKHYSNVYYPKDNETLKVQDEIVSYKKETLIKVDGNRVYVPITLGNNGEKIKTWLLLDTGATLTITNNKILSRLRAEYLSKATFTVADGRKVPGHINMIDFIKVGPYIEYNFKIACLKHVGPEDRGLLGMNFLKKHPFVIDTNRKRIIWQ